MCNLILCCPSSCFTDSIFATCCVCNLPPCTNAFMRCHTGQLGFVPEPRVNTLIKTKFGNVLKIPGDLQGREIVNFILLIRKASEHQHITKTSRIVRVRCFISSRSPAYLSTSSLVKTSLITPSQIVCSGIIMLPYFIILPQSSFAHA